MIVQMVYKGSVSYRNDSVNFIRVNANIEAKIARMDRVVAMITFVDGNGNAVSIPPGITVVFQSDNTPAGQVGQAFIISWMENYVVRLNGQELFRLENQKQQAIGGAADLETRFLQV